MIVCPHCAHQNREGSLLCEKCQEKLNMGGLPASAATRELGSSTDQLAAKATWGTARFGQDAHIIIRIREVPEPIVILPTKQTILGRIDSISSQRPDLDLSPYGALEKGVSRIHAAINRSEDTLTLIDMGSSNGTHLNGQRLAPEQPRVLRDGDEIRLGKLVAHIYFK
jgi:hypothetical protein